MGMLENVGKARSFKTFSLNVMAMYIPTCPLYGDLEWCGT